MKWTVDRSEILHHDKWLKVRTDECRMPNGRVVSPYYVLEYPDWVNVFGITKKNEVVLIKQYRHGAGKVVVELPSGNIEKSDSSPLEAVKRELLEETGYTSDNFVKTGVMSPNPANHNNLVHCFIAKDLELVSPQNLDVTEELEVILVPLGICIDMLKKGEFLHAMHVSSAYCALSHV